MRVVYAFQGRQSVLDMDRPEVVIGRPREGLAVHLDLTPDQQVSRPHARIWLAGEEFWIEDRGSSRRGTQVAGDEIRGTGKRRLRPGDVVRIGAAGGEVLISPDVHQRVWRMVDAEPVSVATKHEGNLAAQRVVRASTAPTA